LDIPSNFILFQFYSEVKVGNIKEIQNQGFDEEYNFKLMQKEYKEFFTIKRKPKVNNLNKISQSLNKFKEFKNSLKSLYNLESQDLMCDNRILNFLEKNNNSNIEIVENFFLETSIDMYREIFKNK
jgi:hypothetical protein